MYNYVFNSINSFSMPKISEALLCINRETLNIVEK